MFPFEKKYFEKENIKNTFVGHPLLEDNEKNKIDISNIIGEDKKIISIFPGSRISELMFCYQYSYWFYKINEWKIWKNTFCFS